MNLGNSAIVLAQQPAAAGFKGDPLARLGHGITPVESLAVATQAASGMLFEMEGVEAAVQAGLEIAIPPLKLARAEFRGPQTDVACPGW